MIETQETTMPTLIPEPMAKVQEMTWGACVTMPLHDVDRVIVIDGPVIG